MPWIDVEEHPDFNLTEEEARGLAKELDKERRKKQPKKMRFYTDHNVPSRATEVLRGLGFNVLTTRDVGKSGHPDENHLDVARKQNRILITCDRDFLYDRRYPLHTTPTLVVCDFGTGKTDEIIATFYCLILLGVIAETTKEDVPTIGKKIDASPSGWTEKTRYQEGDTDRYRYRIYRDEWQVWVD